MIRKLIRPRGRPRHILDVLLYVPGQERQVEDQRQPVPVDQEQEGQEAVHGGFRDDVGIEAVAKVDRVDVVTMPGLNIR